MFGKNKNKELFKSMAHHPSILRKIISEIEIESKGVQIERNRIFAILFLMQTEAKENGDTYTYDVLEELRKRIAPSK